MYLNYPCTNTGLGVTFQRAVTCWIFSDSATPFCGQVSKTPFYVSEKLDPEIRNKPVGVTGRAGGGSGSTGP